jgi:hypothetical protein
MSQRSSMITRRMGDNTAAPLLFRQFNDSIGGTPELEGPHLLEILTLEKKMRTADVVYLLRGEHRSMMNKRPNGLRSCHYIFKPGNKHIMLFKNAETPKLGVSTLIIIISD